MAYTSYSPDGRSVETGIDPQAYDRAHPKAATRPAMQTQPAQQPTAKTDGGTPLLGKAAVARAFDSATFGWGADLLQKSGLVSQQTAREIKQMSKDYSHDNPFASVGMDLAVAGATFLIPGVDAVAGGRAAVSAARVAGEAVPALGKFGATVGESAVGRTVARAADSAIGRGVRYGATQGAAQGSADAGEGNRVSGALHGAASGALMGGVAGGILSNTLGRVGKPVIERAAPSFRNFNEINAALRADGKTIKGLNDFLAKNPDARIADYSPSVARLAAKAGRTSGAAADDLTNALRSDAAGRQGRLVRGTAEAIADEAPGHASLGRQLPPSQQPYPLDKVRHEVADSLDKLAQQKDALYKQSRSEITTITPELKTALDHPEVRDIVKKSMDDYANLRRTDPTSDVAKAARYKAGAEIPSAVLDDVQRKVGAAAQAEGKGSLRYGALKAAQTAIKAQQRGAVVQAQELAARLGNESNNTGLLGAQGFGNAYAQGLKSADIEVFRSMTDEQKQHAALGMLTGLESYLHNAARMPTGKLEEIADALGSKEAIEILGKRNAQQAAKVFKLEGARMRTNAKMAGAKDASGDAGVDKILGHVAASTVSHATGLGHAGTVALRFLMGSWGMSEKAARKMIETAARPGGMAELKSQGVPRKILERLYAMRGAPTTRAAINNQRSSSSLRNDDDNSR